MKTLQYYLLAISVLLITSCNQNEGNTPYLKSADQKAAATTASPNDGTLKNKFLTHTRKELDELQQDLDALKQKMIEVSETEKEKLKFEIENFQQQQKNLENKWNSFKEESSNTWKAFEKSFKESIEDLRSAIRKVSAEKN